MESLTVKERVLDAVGKMSPDATFEDVMERLLFLAKLERGLAEADAGLTRSHEDAKRQLIK